MTPPISSIRDEFGIADADKETIDDADTFEETVPDFDVRQLIVSTLRALGMYDSGRTASLFPRQKLLESVQLVDVIVSPKPPS